MRLPSLSHPGPIIGTAFFNINIAITVLITFGANFGIDWAIVDNYPDKRVIFSAGVFGGLVATLVIIPVLTYCGSGVIKKRIENGLEPPVAYEWFSSSFVPRVIFFSMGSPRRRLLTFIINTLVILGIPLTGILLLACWGDEGFPTSGSHECLLPETWQYCLIDAVWKALCAMICYAMNEIS